MPAVAAAGPLIVVATRFSIYDFPPKIRSESMNQLDTEEAYFDWLYGDKRMADKFNAFEKLTVPSLEHQTYKNFEWLIFTSKKMPAKWLARLEAVRDRVPSAQIIFVKSFNEASKILSTRAYPKEYITVRLDDDDGIHPRLLELYSKVGDKGTILSPKEGLVISPKGRGWKVSRHYYYPTCGAWGLGLVGENVYSLGNHARIHRNVEAGRIRYFSEPALYLRSDTGPGNVTRHAYHQKVKAHSFDLDRYFRQAERGERGQREQRSRTRKNPREK